MTDKEKRQKARKYLLMIQRMDNRVQENLLELERLNATVTQCTAVISDMPRSATRSAEDSLIKYIDLSRELDKETDQYIDFKMKAKQLVFSLDNPIYETILRKRYLNYKPWSVIKFELNYSRRHIFSVHDKALLMFYEKIKDSTK